MKIHPGLNDIISTDKINTKSDVQIAYITTESYEPTVIFETTNTKESFTPLIPYETFDKNEMILFDEKRDIIPDPYNYIIRNGEDRINISMCQKTLFRILSQMNLTIE